MSKEEEKKDPGGEENPPPQHEPQEQPPENSPEKAPEEASQPPPEKTEENNPQPQNPEPGTEAKPQENAEEQKQPENQEPQGEVKENPEEEKQANLMKRDNIDSGAEGEEMDSPGGENEEYEEAEDGEESNENEKDEKKTDYNTKELEDFLTICNCVVKPLEQKDIINRSLTNFQNNIKNSLDQIDKNFSLQSFNLPDLPNKEIAANPKIVRALEGIVSKYLESITIAQDQLINYPKNITSAMMEIDNRKRAVSNWSILAQQLKSETTQRIVEILKLSEDSQKGNTFETKISEFEKTFEDANDYLKFLQTLERSIKDLSSDDLAVIEHSIPGIFHNLKIIWMISKHKDPNKFGFLLEVMAKEIWTKISEKVQLKALFKTNPDEIDASIQLITQANKVANEWNSKYSDTKNKTKWEYAHNKITKDLEYVKTICGKLKNGLNKIKGFLKFLGHDLERVIGGASERIYQEKEKVMKANSYFEN